MKTPTVYIPTIVALSMMLAAGTSGCRTKQDRAEDGPRTEAVTQTPGWKEIWTSGVALSFPEDWKLIDLANENLQEGIEQVFGSDPKYAAAREQAIAAAKQGTIKLIAFDTQGVASGFGTNCNVIVQDAPRGMTLEQMADATVKQLSGIVAPETKPKLEYRALKAGRVAAMRSEIKPPNPSLPALASLGYIIHGGDKVAVVTFSAPVADEARIKGIADKSVGDFRFTNAD